MLKPVRVSKEKPKEKTTGVGQLSSCLWASFHPPSPLCVRRSAK